ncbi:BMP family ABC transporter substrate-binding protein [soil metagenome]
MRHVSRLSLLATVAVASLALAACSSGEAAPEASSEEKVAVLHSEPEGSPWSDLVYDGVASLEADGVTVKRIAGFETAAAEQQIQTAAEQGFNPIVVMEDSLSEAGLSVAEAFPDTDFILFNTVAVSDLPNVETVIISPVSAAYVAGVVAASTTETGQLGFVGGADVPPIANYLCGFTNGVESTGLDVTINTVYAGVFDDPTVGHDLAVSLFDGGSDIVMHAAALTGLGVIAAAEETGKKAIGVDLWQGDVAPGFVLWNALKDGGGASKTLVEQALAGDFTGGQITWGSDGTPIALFDDRDLDALPADLQATVTEAVAGLEDGSISVTC